ncbi:DUF4476 domain-containing protein [Paraflavitalea speifideaquila]|uniref:DUF4476 domain-containing protein n=1 Tax=Paraflavitalea speifideaquila TaxID=3076558 RepID=UPI0028E5C756|nr:DUF4476 domain-containing protein [Paraflavitalea speifideiaquila]
MKTVFTLILLVFAYTVTAHPNNGKLSITNLGNQRLLVEVDGKRFENRIRDDDKFMLIPALSTGIHSLKVYVLTNGRSGITRKPSLLFQKNINVRAQYHIDVVINRFGRVLYDELSMKDPNYVDTDDNDWYNDRPKGRDTDYYPGRDDRDRPRDRDNRYDRPMSDQSFAALKETLTKERFDNSRVTIAKQVIDQNYFTAEQVKQLALMYSFDSYKLDLAKYAYKNTVNKQDYFILYEVFSFSNSKDNLANYIRQFK